MDLRSNRVDLADLNGFIGGTPGRSNTANATPEEREAAAKANASPKFLPDKPISVPRLDWADIHLHYHGAHIEGRNIPLDDLTVVLDAVGGRITVHPISFGVGKGQLTADVDLTPESGKDVHAKMDLRMRNLDVSRMMAATHTFQGAGSVSGVGAIDATGDSLASLMAQWQWRGQNGDGRRGFVRGAGRPYRFAVRQRAAIRAGGSKQNAGAMFCRRSGYAAWHPRFQGDDAGYRGGRSPMSVATSICRRRPSTWR